MSLSNTAVPIYYGEFREKVMRGEIPVCQEISMEMNRIDDLIDNPGVYYDDEAINGWIDFCESELVLTDGSDLHLLDSFKLWGEQVFGWYYFVERSVPVVNENGRGVHYENRRIKKRLINKQYLIVGLCVLAAILAASLIGVALILLRFVMLTRKQKKTIRIANENNEQKTQFIRNISAQMDPTLNTLDASQPGVKALRTFAEHIQTLSDLENSLSEPYEMQEKNIADFCGNMMDKIRGKVQDNVALTVNAPKLSVKIAPEPLEQVLSHLLENAAYYTPAEGKIWLDFKKRGAHTHQFIITDTGCGVSEEKRELIFKPFSEIKDLTQGDGLGLPICSLLATKMNGNLTLDTAYTRGARFVLELHV